MPPPLIPNLRSGIIKLVLPVFSSCKRPAAKLVTDMLSPNLRWPAMRPPLYLSAFFAHESPWMVSYAWVGGLVLFSAVFLHEVITWTQAVGYAICLAAFGVYNAIKAGKL